MASIYAKGRADVHRLFFRLAAMTAPLLRIASRGSPLALVQAREVRMRLAALHGWAESEWERLCPIIALKTSGDRMQDRPLAEAGGKGLFVKEIEQALIDGAADIAVHSLKDMPAEQPAPLVIAAVLPREDPRDVFIARDQASFSALKPGARLGTSSLRRQAQALRARPDLAVASLRGNVATRLAKLERGDADAIILAQAGLKRLGLTPPGAEILDGEKWLPALCQGAIGVELRADDKHAVDLVAPLDDPATGDCVACERGFLVGLDGSCRTPIAGLAVISGGKLRFSGEVLTPDGRNYWTVSRAIMCSSANREALFELGRDAAREIRAEAGARFPRY